ncbi:phosphohydrolase [Staphylococcus hyicus]|uniref:HD domain-containing protein n=1 Tax=Staphylococcus hyicus TaxID=1284 RepID=UPI000D1DB8B1|nr:HD domain-containing protein [Staphylococcus hyicus]PTJ70809.1 phosphohydrolase [Staphylococcus hyicus]PTJ88110.1 phosphohydrolase [Staphylococcus hyicus]
MTTTKCQQAQLYMEHIHKQDTSGHDIAHVRRVTTLAKLIAEDYDDVNIFVIEMAALLHDTIDDKLPHAEGVSTLASFLNDIGVSLEEQKHIMYIINHMSYRKSKEGAPLETIEAQIVQDADRLDAIGAIGIARTFQFAGYFNEPMWTGEATYAELPYIDLNTIQPSAVRHFYEKLLKLKDLMNTPKGRALAQERHAFLEVFLKQFFKEWV